MPDTTPSKEALEAIPNSAWLAAANHVHGGIVSGVCPVFRLPGERCSSCLHIAVTLKAYATARLAQVERERDTALARAEAAEDVGARYTSSAALQNAVVDRLAAAETALNLIAESVIVSVVTLPDKYRVTWGCGICQGEYHKDGDQERYDHKTWCPRAKPGGPSIVERGI